MLLVIKIGIPKRQALIRILAANYTTSFENDKTHRHIIFVEHSMECSMFLNYHPFFKNYFWPFYLYFDRTVKETGNE